MSTARDPVVPPVIETERLRLRPFVEDDAPRLTALLEPFEVVEFTRSFPHPFTLADGRAQLAREADACARGALVSWALEPLKTPRGNLDGLCGGVLAQLDRASDVAELGFWLGKHAQGRGYATEAARAALTWCFEAWGANRVGAHHVARNPASGQVLEQVGLVREGVQPGAARRWERYEDLVLYGLTRAHWSGGGPPATAP